MVEHTNIGGKKGWHDVDTYIEKAIKTKNAVFISVSSWMGQEEYICLHIYEINSLNQCSTYQGPNENDNVTLNGKKIKAVVGQKVSVVAAQNRVKITYSCKKGDCEYYAWIIWYLRISLIFPSS